MKFWKTTRRIEQERIRRAKEGFEALGFGLGLVPKPTWKEDLIAEWEPKVRIEIAYYRWMEVEVSDEYPDGLRSVPCAKDEAEGTQFVYTMRHPVDNHECGLMLTMAEVVDKAPDDYHFEALAAVADYMGNHPDGNFCDNDDCEHLDREGEG